VRRAWPSLALLAVSIVLGWKAHALRLGTLTSPGPGFFPFWLSLGLGVTALALLVTDRSRIDAPGAVRPAIVITAALAAYGLLLEPLGLVLTTVAFLAFLWRVVDGRSTARAVAGAAVATAATWLLFDAVLRVRFPRGVLGF